MKTITYQIHDEQHEHQQLKVKSSAYAHLLKNGKVTGKYVIQQHSAEICQHQLESREKKFTDQSVHKLLLPKRHEHVDHR